MDERLNALTTVFPHMTQTFINMNKTIEQGGQHAFALKDPICYDNKPMSPYSQIFSSAYNSPYEAAAASLFSSSGLSTSSPFEENFYCREQNETELMTIKSNEREKFKAEEVRHI